MAVLRDNGWVVAGSEVSLAAAEQTRVRHQLNVDVVPLNAFHLPKHFHAIGLYHVLEHIYDPRPIIQEVRQALLPGGILHIQMPNRRSIDGRLAGHHWWGLRCPQHVYFYEPQHISTLLGEKFKILSMTTYDPWHSPGTVSITLRNILKGRFTRRNLASSARISTSGPGLLPRNRNQSTRRQIASSILDQVSDIVARGQAAIGWGNVLDVIAVAC